jgi:hypothetical protein
MSSSSFVGGPHISFRDDDVVSSEAISKYENLRVESLLQLGLALKNFPSDAERAEFARLFDRARSILEIDDTELAGMLKVSRPTIGRWARGDSAPHPLGRGSVLQILADLSQEKIKRHIGYRRSA